MSLQDQIQDQITISEEKIQRLIDPFCDGEIEDESDCGEKYPVEF